MLSFRVTNGVHKYRHRRCGPSTCLKCGTHMRRPVPTAQPEYKLKGKRDWIQLNPGCPPFVERKIIKVRYRKRKKR